MAINPLYAKKIEEIEKHFLLQDLPSVSLPEFYDEATYRNLLKDISQIKIEDDINLLSHSFQKGDASHVFDKETLHFLSELLGTKISKLHVELRELGWKDYTILHDKKQEKEGIDIIFCITKDWPEDAGGNIIYVDGTGEYHTIVPEENTMTIVKRTKGIQRFFQYVNHKAKKEKVRYLVATV